jgi:hypothetical protein
VGGGEEEERRGGTGRRRGKEGMLDLEVEEDMDMKNKEYGV